MANPTELLVGLTNWPLTIRPEAAVGLNRDTPPTAPVDGPRQLVAAALEAPFGFDSPMRRALTPDDHVTIVLDEQLPHVAELLAGVLEHLVSGGIDPAAVTVLVPHGGTSAWVDDLPDEFADLTVEVHDPEDQKRLAYLATTKAGRRVYLNRTLIEADFTVVLSGRRFDPTTGIAGAEAAVFPALSDAETLAGFVGQFSTEPPGDGPNALRAEAAEVLWLLGTPFLVQIIEGAGDDVAEVVAGLPDAAAEGVRHQEACWHATVTEWPDLVVAAVSGSRADFLALASAAAAAARVVSQGGRVAVLSAAAPPLNEGAEILRQTDDPRKAAKVLAKRKPDDWPAAALWAFAAQRASLFVAAGWDDDVTEGLYATAVRGPAEVQRLIDAAQRVLVLPDAQKHVVEVRD